MALIDQNLTWKKVEQRLAIETDPVLRRNLEMLLQHMKAEAVLDMEALMATVSERAHYHSYTGDPAAPSPEGKAAVQQFYENFAASGAGKLHLDIDRLDYLFETRMAIIWPIDEDGLFIGEDAYVESDGFAGIAGRKIDPADVVVYRPDALSGAR